ncbi:MAG: hypothetical protein H0V07_05875 [Propionibacteriales bacterium]|nr:hypothetical protein [Propionibacteriales bacterium]
MMRPGLKILRRDAQTVQLGLDWPGVGTLRDTPTLRAVLDAVDGYHDATGVILAATSRGFPREDCEDALSVLIDSGAVVDSAPRPIHEIDESAWSSLWLLAGPGRDVSDILQVRSTCTVWIDGTGLVATAVRELLAAAHLRVCHDPSLATVVVVAGDSEPARARADRAMHTGLPHLWVYVRDLVGVVGPFVVPGKTACLRCVDAARADVDPAWPTLLQSADVRPLPVAPCDAVLATLVAAWAAQEVSVWASDLRPQTYGHVIEIPQGCGPVETVFFDVHPQCGCGWPLWQDTMGA